MADAIQSQCRCNFVRRIEKIFHCISSSYFCKTETMISNGIVNEVHGEGGIDGSDSAIMGEVWFAYESI